MPDLYWRQIIEVFLGLGFLAGLHRLAMIVFGPWLEKLVGTGEGEWDEDLVAPFDDETVEEAYHRVFE